MSEIITQVLIFARSAWRRRRYAVLVAWLVCTLGWIGVASLPDVYKSSAVVYVDTDNILKPLLKGLAVETQSEGKVALMQSTWISQPNLMRVIRQTDLDLSVNSSAETEILVANLERRIDMKMEGPNLISVAFEDNNPKLARDVVQALLNIFVENNLGVTREDMEAARRFIGEQIEIYKDELEAAEQRIVKFKQDNMHVMPGPGGYTRQLDIAENALARAEAQLRDAQARRASLDEEVRSIPQLLPPMAQGGGSLGPPSDLTAQLLEAEAVLDALRSQYTAKHPDVVVAQRRVNALKAQHQREIDAYAKFFEANAATGSGEAEAPSGMSNPVFEQIKLRAVEEEANIAALTGTVAALRAELDSLNAQASQVPLVESELVKLNRDYDVLRSKYNELLSSREAERISRARELQSENVQFRIIVPPDIPAVPSGPNRYLFLVLVLFVGVASGVGFAVVLVYMGDTFSNAGQLREIFSAPILGNLTTSDCAPTNLWVHGRSAVFWVSALALGGLFASLIALEWQVGLHRFAAANSLSTTGGLLERLPLY